LSPALRRVQGCTLAFGLLAAAFAPPAAVAHSHRKNGLEIVHPWTFATSGTGGVAQVCMKIKNASGAPERLLRASSPAAASVEFREPAGAGLPPKPLASLPIPAGQDVELTATGAHLLLSGVRKRLDAYDSFKLTLVFEKAGRVVVDVMVEEAEPETPARQ
jgi:periplasmic copper chaperone A